MTNQTSGNSGPYRPLSRRAGFWSRTSPTQRVGLIAAALLLPCCGGTALTGFLADDPKPITTADPVAERLASERIGTRTTAGTRAAVPIEPASNGSASNGSASNGSALNGPIEATSVPTSAATKRPVQTTRVVTEREAIPFPTRRIEDDTLAKGKTRVRTPGVAGVRTLTYRVTVAGGRETGRKLIATAVTKRPVTKVVLVGTKTGAAAGNCDPNYTPCVPVADDVDCAGGSGNGPEYVTGPIRVIGSDPYDLDRDGDGIACD
ncbi:MAG TPA: G5 domain-containing protein [Actinoplanes sp.]